MSQPVVPEPCPLDLELRLEPGGRLVYVSDLHLTDTGPSDDFGGHGRAVRAARLPPAAPGQVLLALGGDILDLLQVAGSQDRVARVLDGPAAAPIGEALRRLAGRPRARVLYLVGNHDSTLAWDAAARKLVADRFGVSDFALHARVRVQRPGGGGEVVVVAEHGDALDRWNRRTDPFDPLDVPIGDHVVGEFVNRLEAASGRYPQLALNEVDNVRPGLLVPWWLVSNFFYKFMGRALRDFALPLVLLTIALNLAVGLLVGDLGRIAYLGNRAVRWVSSFVLTDLALLALLSTFLAGASAGPRPPTACPPPTRPRTRPRPARATCPSCWPGATRGGRPGHRPHPRAGHPACPGRRWPPTPAAGSGPGPGAGLAVAPAGVRPHLPGELGRRAGDSRGRGRGPVGAPPGRQPPPRPDRAPGRPPPPPPADAAGAQVVARAVM